MKLLVPAVALALAALATTACDRPKTQGTAYNNTGNSASPAPERQPPSTASSSAPATSDTASPSTSTSTTTMAPGPAGDATGAVSETVTTGKIKAAIAADSGLKDTDISVTTNNGVVTLSGSVKSQDQIAIATSLAQRQEGVNRVESQLAVK